MKKIFLNEIINLNDVVSVIDENYHHLANVLRVKINEFFIIQDKNKNEYSAKIINIDKKQILFKIENLFHRNKREYPEIIIMFSLLKGDKNEMLLQKCTEIGADKFIPVITKNCVVNIDAKKDKKLIRFQNVVKEASSQCLREKIPEITDIYHFDEINKFNTLQNKFFGLIKEKSNTVYEQIQKLKNKDSFLFFSGPEGDFTENEADWLLANNWIPVRLSDFIFKSETSAIYFTSAIHSFFYKN